MFVEDVFTKNNIDEFLDKLTKEYIKISKKPEILILVGGASILLNYNFRESTGDIDVMPLVSSCLIEAVKNVSNKYNLHRQWLNDDFKNTKSFSKKLNDVSELYKNIDNILEIRTVRAEYLIAMKLMAGRTDKHDLSDVIGILYEQQKIGNNIKKIDIENAFIFLYEDKKYLPEKSLIFLNTIYDNNNIEELFNEIKNTENKERELLTIND
ncbi:MAG: DUF6036 family nucleotidyltransferase [Treponema sp.]|nr:DUF6036 family nucleotidyltransferase [Treponema sp.]